MKYILLFLFAAFLFLSIEAQSIQKLQEVFEEAGSNKVELEKTIKNFSENPKDSLKLKAAFFLIENMKGHSYSIAKLVDSTNNIIDFNVLDYTDYKEMVSAWDKIESNAGEIRFKRDTIIYDSQIISSEFLIKNIEMAFEAWKKPWSKNLSFKKFCEYILPYRGSNEPLEDWRTYFLEEYSYLEDSLQDKTNPIEVVNFINLNLKSWYSFDSRMYRHPTDLGLKEMLETKVGRCEDMTNLAIYAMRANGIPVMSDYVTHWPNTGNNHAWNSTFDKEGNVLIFMGVGANVGKYKLSNKKAKVYRKTFSTNNKSLTKIKPEYEKVPAWLRSTHSKDVTSEYLDAINFNIELIREKPDSINFAYLCVFNSGKWKATAWGKIENTKAEFKEVGPDLAFMVSYFRNDSLIPANFPFILKNNGKKQILKPNTHNKIKHEFYSTTQKITLNSTDEIRKAKFKENKKYQLYYWDNKWILIGIKKAKKDKPLKFKNIPKNALLWLKQKEGRSDERIFTIQKGEKILW